MILMGCGGSCLFHSLCYGLGSGSAPGLRKDIARFIASNPNLEVAGDPLKDWIEWDGGGSVRSYTAKMGSANGPWGGGIEMAACSRLHKVNIHVYEKQRLRSGFKRISCFDVAGAKCAPRPHSSLPCRGVCLPGGCLSGSGLAGSREASFGSKFAQLAPALLTFPARLRRRTIHVLYCGGVHYNALDKR